MNYIKEAHKNTITYDLFNKAQGLVKKISESKNPDLFNRVVAFGVATGAITFATRVAFKHHISDLGDTHCEVRWLNERAVEYYYMPSLLTNYNLTCIGSKGLENKYNFCYSSKLPLQTVFLNVCMETISLLPKAISAGLDLSIIILLAYLADLSVQIIFLVLSNQNLNTAEAKKD